jgi:hypothetical protein
MFSKQALAKFREFTALAFPHGIGKGAFDSRASLDRARHHARDEDDDDTLSGSALSKLQKFVSQRLSPNEQSTFEALLRETLDMHGGGHAEDEDDDEPESLAGLIRSHCEAHGVPEREISALLEKIDAGRDAEPIPIKRGETETQRETFGRVGRDQPPPFKGMPTPGGGGQLPRRAMDALPPSIRSVVAQRATTIQSRAQASYEARFPDTLKIKQAF